MYGNVKAYIINGMFFQIKLGKYKIVNWALRLFKISIDKRHLKNPILLNVFISHFSKPRKNKMSLKIKLSKNSVDK